jgi:hypothetical protein
MFKPVRIVATVVFLASIALVFVGAFVIKNDVRPLRFSLVHDSHIASPVSGPLHRCLPIPDFRKTDTDRSLSAVFVIVEYLAYTWYTLSYIPYARAAVLKIIGM